MLARSEEDSYKEMYTTQLIQNEVSQLEQDLIQISVYESINTYSQETITAEIASEINEASDICQAITEDKNFTYIDCTNLDKWLDIKSKVKIREQREDEIVPPVQLLIKSQQNNNILNSINKSVNSNHTDKDSNFTMNI